VEVWINTPVVYSAPEYCVVLVCVFFVCLFACGDQRNRLCIAFNEGHEVSLRKGWRRVEGGGGRWGGGRREEEGGVMMMSWCKVEVSGEMGVVCKHSQVIAC